MISLIYRRVILLSNAEAHVCAMARPWGTVISGRIGNNTLRVMEIYTLRSDAQRRARTINRRGQAMIVSIEEVLYPYGMPLARYKPEWASIQERQILAQN